MLAFIEAASVTGPAKNLLQFGKLARHLPTPIELSIATFRRPGSLVSDTFLAAAENAGLPVAIISESSPLDFSSLRQIRDLCRIAAPDLIQSHGVKSHFLLAMARLHRVYPWVAWHHGYTRPTFKQHLYNQLDRASLRLARHVVTVTGAFVPELSTAGVRKERISVVPNAVEVRMVAAKSRQIVNGPAMILTIGRLSREKDQANLLRAVAEIAPSMAQPPECILVGEGPERENLKRLAASLGIHVQFVGQVANVQPWFDQADIFVLPSLSEGSPNVLIEAMASALPIVATAVGGVEDAVTDQQHALVVPPANPSALGSAIRRLLLEPALAERLALAAQQRATTIYDPKYRVETLSTLYHAILKRFS